MRTHMLVVLSIASALALGNATLAQQPAAPAPIAPLDYGAPINNEQAKAVAGAAFAEATLGILRDPLLRSRVAAGALRLYVDHLSWQRIVDELLAAI